MEVSMFLSSFFSTVGMDEHPGSYFFSGAHFIYLLFNLILFIFLWYVMKKQSRRTQNIMINVFLTIMLVLKYAGDALFIYEYYNVEPALSSYPHAFWDVDTFFSFQMCGVTNILLPLVIWFDIKPLKEFVFASSILGGIAVILYPVTVLYGHPYTITLPIIRSTFVHFFLLFIPLYLINRGDYKLDKKRGWQVALGLILLALWATFGNYVIDIGANNLYLMENPFAGMSIPLLSDIPDYWHIIVLAVMVTLGYVIIYQLTKLFQPGKFNQIFYNKQRKES